MKNNTYTKETLFIGGKESDYIQAEDTELIQQFFPLATIKVLEHSGHLPHVDDANGFYALMKNFFF